MHIRADQEAYRATLESAASKAALEAQSDPDIIVCSSDEVTYDILFTQLGLTDVHMLSLTIEALLVVLKRRGVHSKATLYDVTKSKIKKPDRYIATSIKTIFHSDGLHRLCCDLNRVRSNRSPVVHKWKTALSCYTTKRGLAPLYKEAAFDSKRDDDSLEDQCTVSSSPKVVPLIKVLEAFPAQFAEFQKFDAYTVDVLVRVLRRVSYESASTAIVNAWKEVVSETNKVVHASTPTPTLRALSISTADILGVEKVDDGISMLTPLSTKNRSKEATLHSVTPGTDVVAVTDGACTDEDGYDNVRESWKAASQTFARVREQKTTFLGEGDRHSDPSEIMSSAMDTALRAVTDVLSRADFELFDFFWTNRWGLEDEILTALRHHAGQQSMEDIYRDAYEYGHSEFAFPLRAAFADVESATAKHDAMMALTYDRSSFSLHQVVDGLAFVRLVATHIRTFVTVIRERHDVLWRGAIGACVGEGECDENPPETRARELEGQPQSCSLSHSPYSSHGQSPCGGGGGSPYSFTSSTYTSTCSQKSSHSYFYCGGGKRVVVGRSAFRSLLANWTAVSGVGPVPRRRLML